MTKEQDINPVVIIGLFGSPLLFLLSFSMAVYYVVKAIKIKETTYVCDRCKSKLKADEIIRSNKEVLLKTIKKRNLTFDRPYRK